MKQSSKATNYSMRPILTLFKLLITTDRRALTRGAALSVIVLLMGVALLGLSGWFITATGLAGLAGIGIAFDVFRPSAGVRFLALGRTGARYGERVLTHDATLRALAALRVILLRSYARRDAKALMILRSETALTRIISDVDALDGLILRLTLPLFAGFLTFGLIFAALAWIVALPVGLTILLGYVPLTALIFILLARQSLAPSAQAEETRQKLWQGVIDMIRDRDALILTSQLPRKEIALRALDQTARDATGQLDRTERHVSFLLSILVACVAAATFLMGAKLLNAGTIGTAPAIIGFFVALALAEALMPLRRGVSELGRMLGAACRIAPHSRVPNITSHTLNNTEAPLLDVDIPGLHFTLEVGSAIALTGPSGTGKSTLLMQIAGLDEQAGIRIKGRTPCDWPEDALRDMLTTLPQRSALLAGTVRDNLSLAGETSDDRMWAVLEAVALKQVIEARGGLDVILREQGAGLSGGQTRRLCLARTLLKVKDILILDEPTEGLDPETAYAVLQGVRSFAPNAAILAALHRGADHPIFDKQVRRSASLGD